MFYAEFQDGRRKWRENNFWHKSPFDSVDILGVKKFEKIVVSCTISKINEVLCFTQNFKMAAKMTGKQFLGKVAS